MREITDTVGRWMLSAGYHPSIDEQSASMAAEKSLTETYRNTVPIVKDP